MDSSERPRTTLLFQMAMPVARGQFVRFVDSDDWLTPQATPDRLERAWQTGADIVVAGYEHHDDSAEERRVLDYALRDDRLFMLEVARAQSPAGGLPQARLRAPSPATVCSAGQASVRPRKLDLH